MHKEKINQTKKLSPVQLQGLEFIKSELFSDQSLNEFSTDLDKLFVYMVLSDDFDSGERYSILNTFNAFKRLLTALETGDINSKTINVQF